MRIGWILISILVWFGMDLQNAAGAEEKVAKPIETKPTKKSVLEKQTKPASILNLSLYYPVSLNESEYDTSNLNLSLLYSRIGAVYGVDLGLGVNAVDSRLIGLQIAGLIGVVGQHLRGTQIAGLISVAGNSLVGMQLAGLIGVSGNGTKGIQASGLIGVSGHSASGLQLSGLISVTGKSFRGLQLAPVLNITGDNLSGSQVALIGNVTGQHASGFQIAPLMNVAGSTLHGFQLGGLLNVAGTGLSGFQIGGYNRVGQLKGFQMGVYNQANAVSGFQIGLVNMVKDGSGIPIGIVNLSPTRGRIRMTTFGSNLMAINTGIRFEVDPIYSVVHLGLLNLYGDQNRSLSYGFCYGAYLPIDFGQSGQRLSWDIGYQFIDNQDFFDSSQSKPDHQVIHLRGAYALDLSDWIAVFASLGVGYVWEHFDLQQGQFHPILDVGLILL